LKDQPITFFELGIFFGNSVRGWSRYFADSAEIYAADIDHSYLINAGNIKSFVCDQDSPESIANLWQNFPNESYFDIIVEDGKHEFESNVCFLQNSLHMLKPGGLFIIEDLTHRTKELFQSAINSGIKDTIGVEEIFVLDIPNPKNALDNCILVIRK